MERLPDPTSTMERLKPVFHILYESFEQGTQLARGLFDEWGKQPDPHLFAALTRYHALPRIDAGFAGLDGYSRVPLANSGIQFSYGGYELRCWKTTDGELPDLTSSKAKLRYVHQLPLGQPFGHYDEGDSMDVKNLFIQWEYDRTKGIVELTLVCPKAQSSEVASVEICWSVRIPHPSETFSIPSPALQEAEAAQDLDIIRLRASATGAQSS